MKYNFLIQKIMLPKHQLFLDKKLGTEIILEECTVDFQTKNKEIFLLHEKTC